MILNFKNKSAKGETSEHIPSRRIYFHPKWPKVTNFFEKHSGSPIIVNLFLLTGRPEKISRQLFDAIRKQESGGEENITGDGGKAYGPYQIWESYYKDAVEYNPKLKEGGKTWENTKGPGSTEYSEEVMKSYMDRYATESRLGRKPTDEDIARIHNGGPNGYKKDCTLEYWKRVEKNLQSN